MNLVEELQSLDINDVGRWPLAFRVAVIVIVFLVVLGLGIYWFIIEDKAPQLSRAQAEEQELRVTFENKQRKAANYDAYKAQLAQIEQSFGTMLRQLPGKTEIPSRVIGDLTVEELKALDPVSYIRYGIVYLGLDDLESVRAEIDRLLEERE